MRSKHIAALTVAGLGLLAWTVVIGAVIIDTQQSVMTPTAPSPSGTPVAERPPATPVPTVTTRPETTPIPTVAPSLTPVPSPTPPPTTLPMFVVPAPSLLPPTETDEPPTPIVVIVTGEPSVTPGGCAPPPGWVAYRIEEGDTLFGFQLGSEGQVDVATIREANCLQGNLLRVGQVIFLPEGVAENSPKIDTDPAPLPGGPSRAANCPCVITVRAGLRREQIAAVIDSLPVGFSGRDFLAATAPGAATPPLWFLASKPAGASLEGFLMPGQYTVDNGTSAVTFRDMMLEAFGSAIGTELEGAAAARGLSFWQVVILASIIQRESGDPADQPLVASVFYNRLASNRGLAATVTLQYALGRPGNWWPRVTNINADSPYNTYRYRGLPPSPISNPGPDAIRAAAYPAQTDYLYFSARCDGQGHFYARTFEEFQQGLNCGGN